MVMVNRDARLEELGSEKQEILKLAELQIALRKAVCKKISSKQIGRDDLTRHIKIHRHKLLGFLDGDTVVVGTVLLKEFESFLGGSTIIDEIRRTVEPIKKSPMLGLAVYSADTISLVYALYESFYSAPLTRREIFAEAFGDQKDLVLEVFSKKKTAYDELQNPGNAQALLDRLTCSSLNADVQVAHDAAIEDYKKRREELKPLEDLLLGHLGTKAAVADALGIHKTKLRSMMQDPPQFLQYWINDVDEMVAQCKAKLEELAPKKKPSAKTSREARDPTIKTPREKAETKNAPAEDNTTCASTLCTPMLQVQQAQTLLSEMLKALRGNIQALKVLSDAKVLRIRNQDRLEMARCLVGLLEIKAIDKAILSEALHGQPVENLEALSDIFALLTPFQKVSQ